MKKLEKSKKKLIRPNLYDYLKVLALITMLVDHIGYYLFPEYIWLRLIGRVAFPIFLFLVGFSGSYSWRWDIPLLGIFLWICSQSYSLYFGSGVIVKLNILLGITLSRAVLFFIDKKKSFPFTLLLCIVFLSIDPFLSSCFEYRSLCFFMALWGRIARNYKKFFYLGVFSLLLTFFHSIYVFDFGFSQGSYVKVFFLGLFFSILYCLFFLLSKDNIPILSNKKSRDRFVLFFGKHALAFYGIHILILMSINLFLNFH